VFKSTINRVKSGNPGRILVSAIVELKYIFVYMDI